MCLKHENDWTFSAVLLQASGRVSRQLEVCQNPLPLQHRRQGPQRLHLQGGPRECPEGPYGQQHQVKRHNFVNVHGYHGGFETRTRFHWLPFGSSASLPIYHHLCSIYPCPSRIGHTEEQTKSKSTKHSVKPPWTPWSKDFAIPNQQVPLQYLYSEHELSGIADRVFHEADDNSDGQLTFEEFVEATKHVEIENRMSFLSLGTWGS